MGQFLTGNPGQFYIGANKLAHFHYGLSAPLIILWAFTSRAKEERFLELVRARGGVAGAVIATQVVEERGTGPHWVWPGVFEGSWRRAVGGEVSLARLWEEGGP